MTKLIITTHPVLRRNAWEDFHHLNNGNLAHRLSLDLHFADCRYDFVTIADLHEKLNL